MATSSLIQRAAASFEDGARARLATSAKHTRSTVGSSRRPPISRCTASIVGPPTRRPGKRAAVAPAPPPAAAFLALCLPLTFAGRTALRNDELTSESGPASTAKKSIAVTPLLT